MRIHDSIQMLLLVFLITLLIVSCYAILNEVYITAPSDGDYTTESQVEISVYTSGEIANLEVFHNGEMIGSGGATEYSVAAIENTANSVGAFGYDEIGNLVDSDEITYYHDDISPSLTVGHVQSGRSLTFSGLALENFVISEFTYEHQTFLAVQGTIAAPNDGNWQLVLNNVPYTRDDQTIVFEVIDRAGNSDEESYVFSFQDTVAPNLAITSPGNLSTHSTGPVVFSGTAEDDYELGALWYGVDDGNLQVIQPAANGAWGVSINFLSIATYEIRFIAIDAFFNFSQQIITISIT